MPDSSGGVCECRYLDSIIASNPNTKERKFMLYYTIHNLTDSKDCLFPIRWQSISANKNKAADSQIEYIICESAANF
jgi:hypothetical protein